MKVVYLAEDERVIALHSPYEAVPLSVYEPAHAVETHTVEDAAVRVVMQNGVPMQVMAEGWRDLIIEADNA